MIERHEPLVSIVTPVYNGEKYLRQCIESVLAQTYTHWEYIIVNNCSTDRTLDIAEEYAAADPRIRVHNSEQFVGVDANHNNAFRQISPTSKYCKVVAADDWIFPECLEKMVSLAEEHPSVAIVQAYRLQGNSVAGDGVPYPSTFMRGRDACRLWLLRRPSIFGAATGLLYRSDIVRSRHAFYDESNLAADTGVCLEFLGEHDYGFVHQVLSFQRLRRASWTGELRHLEANPLTHLYELVTYGPRDLTEEELQRAIREHLRRYYGQLGSVALRGRSREFWRLHRHQLATLGYPLRPSRVLASSLIYLLGIVFNPGRTTERLAERRRREREDYTFE
jgi:glycosyltransferase involved in cell wall biosynthesis